MREELVEEERPDEQEREQGYHHGRLDERGAAQTLLAAIDQDTEHKAVAADAVTQARQALERATRMREAFAAALRAGKRIGNPDLGRNNRKAAAARAEGFRTHLAETKHLSAQAAAELNRGVVHYQQGRYAPAQADLEAALRDGADPATAHYNLALVRLAQHDEAAARRQLEVALEHDPGHADARSLRERLLRHN